MTPGEREALAGIRVLVCVARADGLVTASEIAALESAVDGRWDLETLLAEDISLDHELTVLGDDARKAVYDAAWVLANVDGLAPRAELAVLERIRPPHHEGSVVDQAIGELRDTLVPGTIEPVYDAEQRAVEIEQDTLKYALLCAGLGALPVPGVTILTDLVVVGLQVKLVRDIGLYWGEAVDAASARTLLTSVAGSVGMRVAANNLARLVPGWGSVFGAATSFASTIAIARTADKWFAGGRQESTIELQATYEHALAAGKVAFQDHKEHVWAKRESIAALNAQVAAGTMTQAEYEQAVAALK